MSYNDIAERVGPTSFNFDDYLASVSLPLVSLFRSPSPVAVESNNTGQHSLVVSDDMQAGDSSDDGETNNNDINDDASCCSACEQSSGETSPTGDLSSAPASALFAVGKRKPTIIKKVSFADENGDVLTRIRVFSEKSDVPPVLSRRVLERYSIFLTPSPPAPTVNGNCCAAGNERSPRDAKKKPEKLSPLCPYRRPVVQFDISSSASAGIVANFCMPVADRRLFFDKLDANCVTLERVRDLSTKATDGTPELRFAGTVCVKNLAFVKSVVVRCTFDDWYSSVDTAATFLRPGATVASRRPNGQPFRYDVFEFVVDCPDGWITRPGSLRIQLAVRFDCAGKSFWDNCDGQNYELVALKCSSSVERRNTSDWLVFGNGYGGGKDEVCWSEFASWHHLNGVSPVY